MRINSDINFSGTIFKAIGSRGSGSALNGVFFTLLEVSRPWLRSLAC